MANLVPGPGANFTPPASVPDYFGQSTTPGSRVQIPILPGAPGLAPVGTGIGTEIGPASTSLNSPPGGISITAPDTFQPGGGSSSDSFTFNDPAFGGSGSSGSVTDPAGNPLGQTGGTDPTSTSTGGTSNTPQIPATGTGTNTGGLPAIGAFTGNWFVRMAIIALGIVLIAAAAWELSKQRGTA